MTEKPVYSDQKPLMTAKVATERLRDCDDGHFRGLLHLLESDGVPDGPEDCLELVEVLVYVGRPERALEILAALDVDGDMALRAELLRGEALSWLHRCDEALAIARGVVDAEPVDRSLALRAELLVARVTTRMGRFAEAAGLLTAIRPKLERAHRFWWAIATHGLAWSELRLERIQVASRLANQALVVFTELEADRWTALARGLLAMIMTDLGAYEAALAECDEAERLSAGLSSNGDMLLARANAARCLVALGRYKEACERLSIIEADGAHWSTAAEIAALTCLIVAEAMSNKPVAAAAHTARMLHLARQAEAVAEIRVASMLDAWLCGKSARLEELIRIDSGLATDARVLYADVMATVAPDRARAALDYVICHDGVASGLFAQVARRAEEKLRTAPVRLGVNGELIIDTSAGWPDYAALHALIDRVLFERAMASAAGVQSEAARLLGLTRSRMFDLKSRVEGVPSRPRKAGPGRGGASGEEKAENRDREVEIERRAHRLAAGRATDAAASVDARRHEGTESDNETGAQDDAD